MAKKFGVIIIGALFLMSGNAQASSMQIQNFQARPPIHVYKKSGITPTGLSPDQIKKIYNLPKDGGHGTIAIIAAYSTPYIEKDLNYFSSTFNLPDCKSCLEVKNFSARTDDGWAMEATMDVEWAHAIAPEAKILLVEAKAQTLPSLLEAVDYAKSRSDVVAVSMSWGGPEFPGENLLDQHFTSDHDITFFAASGDRGNGVSWPAASGNVVAVGGTSLHLKSDSSLSKEVAWNGSGGGISLYEKQPDYQLNYDIKKAQGARAVPDVAYNADPRSGYAVYKSSSPSSGAWYLVGGTSAGSPQWAAIKSLGLSASNAKFYSDKASGDHKRYFRDIVSGSNGDCAYYCDSRRRYDYVTGLGSPLTVNF